MKILVTGGTGFVGSHLLEKLKLYDYKIVLRTSTNLYDEEKQILFNKDSITKFKNDIKDFNPDVVIHLASFLTSTDDTKNIINIVESNILFTSLLLEALKSTDMKLFINTGTFAEYFFNDGIENPAYFYAASKTAIKPIIKYFQNIQKFKCINIIPYTIYGGISKSKKVIDYIIDSIDSEKSLDMTNGEQVLDFIHVDDVVDFYIHCINNMDMLKDKENYHLGSGKGTSIKELSLIIEKESNKKTNINWGAREYRPLDIMRAIAPIYKLEKELNWKPIVSIENGIKDIINGEK